MGSRVVLVDDDQLVLRSVSLVLRRRGYEVRPAVHGRDALTQIEAQAPDVVLSDIDMPVMDGLGLAAALRRSFPALPVVLFTGLEQPGLRERAAALGVVEVLNKPLLPTELCAALEAAMGAPLGDGPA